MAEAVRETTTVAIIGAGPGGLTLANLLRSAGIACVVLERQTRSYVEQRQRAGVLEHYAVQIFEEWGLAERVLADMPVNTVMEFRRDGAPRFVHLAGESRQIPQQFLVRRLIAAFLADGGDLRFAAADVAVHDIASTRPRVTYRDEDGLAHEIECDYIAGCDGFHGVTRRSVPDGVFTTYTYDHGIGWFTVLADTPPPQHPLFAVSRHGFAAQFPRGPHASRYYLQCPPGDDLEKWPDERIWAQLRARLGDDALPVGPITEKAVVEMRSFVVDPMSHGRLFLVGDAAHIITPMGGKGMNLAVADAAALARGLSAAVRDGDGEPLRAYSATCLRRTWTFQEFSRWMTEMLHDSGDVATAGPFRRQLALARLDRLFASGTAAADFAELMAGTG